MNWRSIKISVSFVLVLGLLFGVAQAFDNVYLVANHHTAQFDAYKLHNDGTITFQQRIWLSCQGDPSGLATWIKQDPVTYIVTDAYLFITGEFSNNIEIIDALTLTDLGCISTGAGELAGIGMDNAHLVLYAIERQGNKLWAFDWDYTVPALTIKAGFPVTLPSVSSAFGLALDSDRGIIYIADAAGWVRGFDVTTLNEIFTWQPTSAPLDVAVDEERNILYTTHPDGYCASGQPGGSDYTCMYDIDAATETIGPAGSEGGMGCSVWDDQGFLYLTHGCYGDEVTVWDTSVTPWVKVDDEGDVGNPAGIVVPNVGIPGDPGVQLATSVPDTSCVLRGEEFTLTVPYFYVGTFGNLPVNNVVVEVWLDEDIDFVSCTGGCTYDPVSNSVLWDVGTMVVGDSYLQQIVVEVANSAEWEDVLNFHAQIRSDLPPEEWDEVFASVTVCEEPPIQYVDLDIKPTSCPNPLNVKPFLDPPANALSKKGGVLPVAILGSDLLDVHDIDVSTLLLAGVAPIRHHYEDVAGPVVDGEECECTTAGPDGYTDLTLKFMKRDIVAALGPVADGDVVAIKIHGFLNSGMELEGTDCVVIRSEHLPAPITGNGQLVLGPAVPNPFNPRTRISYILPEEDFVRLSVYDVTGKLIERLVSEQQSAGEYVVEWDAHRMASGIYFYRIEVGNVAETRKMILLK